MASRGDFPAAAAAPAALAAAHSRTLTSHPPAAAASYPTAASLPAAALWRSDSQDAEGLPPHPVVRPEKRHGSEQLSLRYPPRARPASTNLLHQPGGPAAADAGTSLMAQPITATLADSTGPADAERCTGELAEGGALRYPGGERPLGLPSDVMRLVLQAMSGEEAVCLTRVSRGMAAAVHSVTGLGLNFNISFELTLDMEVAKRMGALELTEAETLLIRSGYSVLGVCQPGQGCGRLQRALESRFAGQISRLGIAIGWDARQNRQLPECCAESAGPPGQLPEPRETAAWPVESQSFLKADALQELSVVFAPPPPGGLHPAFIIQTLWLLGSLLRHRPSLHRVCLSFPTATGQHPLCRELLCNGGLDWLLGWVGSGPPLHTLELHCEDGGYVSLSCLPRNGRLLHLQLHADSVCMGPMRPASGGLNGAQGNDGGNTRPPPQRPDSFTVRAQSICLRHMTRDALSELSTATRTRLSWADNISLPHSRGWSSQQRHLLEEMIENY